MHERLQQWFSGVLPYQLTYTALLHLLCQVGINNEIVEAVISLVFCFLFHGTSLLIPLTFSCGVFVLLVLLKTLRCGNWQIKGLFWLAFFGVVISKNCLSHWMVQRLVSKTAETLSMIGTMQERYFFSLRYTFRYTLMRSLSFCIDSIDDDFASLPRNVLCEFWCLVIYITFFPTYFYGPLIPYSQFSKQWKRKKKTEAKIPFRAQILECMGQITGCWILAKTIYQPESLLDLELSFFWYWLTVKGFLIISFLESHIPFTVAWICTGLRQVECQKDTPTTYFKCTSSVHDFCRNFHVSWHKWLMKYVYIPAGGGPVGTVLSFLVSLSLHDFEKWTHLLTSVLNLVFNFRHWCIVAAVGGFLLFLEKMTAGLEIRNYYLIQCLLSTLTESVVLPVLPCFSIRKCLSFVFMNTCFVYLYKSSLKALEHIA